MGFMGSRSFAKKPPGGAVKWERQRWQRAESEVVSASAGHPACRTIDQCEWRLR
jgi:hypothetical protein